MDNLQRVKIGDTVFEKDFIRFDYVPEVSNFRNCSGYCFDRITNVVTGEVFEEGHDFNTIVDSIGKLAAARFRGGTDFQGLQMWAIGSGASSWDARWDSNLPPSTDSLATRLVNEIGRLPLSIAGQDSYMTYVDQNGAPTESLTNRLKVMRRFGRNDVNGEWREFALFGGNADETRGSGIMINHRIHRIMTKTSDMTVDRFIIFTFN